MEILKVKNAFGIKELRNASYIKGNTLLYAPNGVMKTSFADFLNCVKNNSSITDAFEEYSSPTEFEIRQFDKTYTESNNDGTFQIVVFSSKIAKDNVFTDPLIANLAMSAELRRSYDEHIKNFKEIKHRIDSIVSTIIKGSKKTVPDSWKDVANIFGAEEETEALTLLLDFDETNEKLFLKAPYSKVCDNKIVDIFADVDFGAKLETYKTIVEKKMEDKVFNNGFTYFELEAIFNSVSKTHYFLAKHFLTIGDNVIDSEEKMGEFLSEQKNKIFSSQEVEQSFLDVKASLNKNTVTRGFADFLTDNREILDYSDDYNRARKVFCRTKIANETDVIKVLLDEYNECYRKLISLIEKARNEESAWKKSKDLFNSRFGLNRVDLDIRTVIENDLPVPQVVMIDKQSKKQLNTLMKNRLSSGEYRALLILNLLFEIESKRNMWPDGFTLVLDDIADSFDYKNKYAICRYIEELFKEKNIQVIVMTHNYDFYRCCSFFLSKIPHKSLTASRLRFGAIELKNAGHTELQDLSFVKSWSGELKSEPDSEANNVTTLLAYFPVLRNIIEMNKDDDDDPDYVLITQYLHYSSSYTKNLNDLRPLFAKHSLKISELYYSMNFKDILYTVFETNSKKKIDVFDIRTKMALASVLRILFEKFVYNKSGKTIDDFKEKNNVVCQKLYDKLVADKLLSDKDKEYCEFAKIVANPYIHVNAFMYEQLIDNSGDKIIECLKHFVRVNGF